MSLTSFGKNGACKLTQIALQKSASPIMINVDHWRLVNFGSRLRILTLSIVYFFSEISDFNGVKLSYQLSQAAAAFRFFLSQFYINSKVQPDIDNSSCRMVRCALKSVHSFHHLQFTWLKVTSQTRIQQFNRRLIKKIVRFLVCFHKYHTNKITNVVTITFKISLIKSTKFATVIQEKSIFFVRHNFTV